MALLSAAAFGTSGVFAKGLLTAGWSPLAAVAFRVALGATAMLVPGVLALRGRWQLVRTGWTRFVLFGLLAVAGCQLAYFLAVDRLPVAIALLLEFCGVLLVVLWLWLRRGLKPRPLTVVGMLLALGGLVLVLDAFGAISIDLIGVLWALVAAVGLAAYFVISADDTSGIPPLALASGGLVVAAATLFAAGAVGVLPFEYTFVAATMAGITVPWWVLVACLGLLATAFAYSAGTTANRRLGSKVASFVGLSEVLFAVLWAWLLLSEMPAVIQLVGGAAILIGVVLIKVDEDSAPVSQPASELSVAAGADHSTVPATVPATELVTPSPGSSP